MLSSVPMEAQSWAFTRIGGLHSVTHQMGDILYKIENIDPEQSAGLWHNLVLSEILDLAQIYGSFRRQGGTGSFLEIWVLFLI